MLMTPSRPPWAPRCHLNLAAAVVFLTLVHAGCPRHPANPEADSQTLSVRDDLDRIVSLEKPARRIASLSPSNTEILFALGCGKAVVLRDTLSSYPPEARTLPATSPFQLSAEHVAGFSPDLVLLSHADATRVEAIRRLGLQTATFDPRSLEHLYRNIRSIAHLCGATERALPLVENLSRRALRVQAAVRGRAAPLVYVETDGSDPLKPWTCGRGSLTDELLRLAGGRNLIEADRAFLQISAEEVFTADPEVILIMGVETQKRLRGRQDLVRRPGWDGLRAVRTGRIIDSIHADLLSRPGPRLLLGLEQLAAALHPQAFAAPARATPTAPDTSRPIPNIRP